jgi:hypothetical protein
MKLKHLSEANLPLKAKLLNDAVCKLVSVEAYKDEKTGALYVVNGNVLNEYTPTNKNLSVDDIKSL